MPMPSPWMRMSITGAMKPRCGGCVAGAPAPGVELLGTDWRAPSAAGMALLGIEGGGVACASAAALNADRTRAAGSLFI